MRDEGQGIDAQLLPRLFDLFMQGDRSLDRAQGGLGIGLTIVKLLVEMHGGTVEARSAGLGKGSDSASGCRARISQRPPLTPQVAGENCLRPRRVLVVEDNTDAAESLRALLRTDGHAGGGGERRGGRSCHAGLFPADIVLLDVGLPRMDGFMVAHAIRDVLRWKAAAEAARTHRLWREEDRPAALKAGFDGTSQAGGSAAPAADLADEPASMVRST